MSHGQLRTETGDGFFRERTAYLRRLAIDCLKQYRGGFADLERTDRDLKSIIRSLTDVADPSWVELLFRHWGRLEIIYACVLAEERLQLTAGEERDVRDVVAALRSEFEGYQPPSVPDDGQSAGGGY